jgi:hypothetical protein
MINSDTISTTDSDNGKPPATESGVEEIKADLKAGDQSSFPVNEPEQRSEANEPNRESSLTRRALLLKAGWAVPVILSVGLPSTVLAGIASPVRHHHKPHDPKHKGHFDFWPKKKHGFDDDKKRWFDNDKKHWFDDGKKRWFDDAKKKPWFDDDKKKHGFDTDKKKHGSDDDKKRWFDDDKKRWFDDDKKRWFDDDKKKHDRLWW